MFPTLRHDMTPILTYIHEHLGDHLETQGLAHRMHLSQTTFILRFKQALGQTPYHYLVQTRLTEAARRLRTTTGTISGIAHDCGYTSHSHFTHEFHRVMGLTPEDYRRQRAGDQTGETLPLVCALWSQVSVEVQAEVLALLHTAAPGTSEKGTGA